MSSYRDNLARPLPKQTLPKKQDAALHKPAPRSAESKLEAKDKLLWLATILFCVTVSLLLVGRYAQMVSLNYHLEDLSSQLQAQQDTNLRLQTQVLQLESAGRIENYAENKLGMKPVKDNQVVVLPSGSQK